MKASRSMRATAGDGIGATLRDEDLRRRRRLHDEKTVRNCLVSSTR